MVVITSVVMFMLVIILVIKFMQVIILVMVLVNLLNVDNHNDHDVHDHIRISMAGSAGELDVSHHLEADPQNHLLQPPSSSSHLKPGARRHQRPAKQWSSSAQLKAKLNDWFNPSSPAQASCYKVRRKKRAKWFSGTSHLSKNIIGDRRRFVNVCVFSREASVLLVVSQNLPPDPFATYFTKILSPGTK